MYTADETLANDITRNYVDNRSINRNLKDIVLTNHRDFIVINLVISIFFSISFDCDHLIET
jgi:hypothetical protein